MKCNFIRLKFEVRHEQGIGSAIPLFAADEAKAFIDCTMNAKMTILGADGASLLTIQQIVDYVEQMMEQELQEWEFLPSVRHSPHEMTSIIQVG